MKQSILVAALFVAASWLPAGDWPCYLGPHYNNTSDETGLLSTWPADGPPKLWEVDLGPGFAAPAVVGDRLYAIRRIQSKEVGTPQKDIFLCLNAQTGAEIWKTEADTQTDGYGFPGSRTSPTVKDGRVFVIGPGGDLYALTATDGKLLWRHNLLDEFQAKRPSWAVGQSPLVWQDLVICAPSSQQAGLAAFTAATGKLVWKVPAGTGPMSYSSPILGTIEGVEQILAVTGASNNTMVGGYDPRTGKCLWNYTGWRCNIPIPAPLHLGDGRVFITGEYGAGSAMIQVTKTGTAFSVKELYKTQSCESQIHQPFLVGNHLYANSNGNKRHDGFVCIDLNGTLVWSTGRDPNFERGSMLLADGHIYAINGNNGTMVVIEPSPDGYKQIAETKFLGGKTVWAPLVLSNGLLYIRDQQKLVCLDIRAKK